MFRRTACRSRRPVLAALILVAPFLLAAQSARLDGIWIVPHLAADGPGFYQLNVTVTGDSLTGIFSDTGRGAENITGKFVNGRITFTLPRQEMGGVSLERSFSGQMRDETHLDLTEEKRTAGMKMPRKAPAKAGANPLEGDWGVPGHATLSLHIAGEVLTGQLTDTFVQALHRELIAEVPKQSTLENGRVQGTEFSYHFKNKLSRPTDCSGSVVSDQLVLKCSTTEPLQAFRVATATQISSKAGNGEER